MVIINKAIYTKSGVVERGTRAARDIGYPTANIRYADSDISGTYAGKVIVGKTEYRAAIYANEKRHVLEAHLLDFSGDLYGKRISVILLWRLVESKVFRGTQDERSFVDWAVAEVEKYFNQEE